MKRLGVIGLGKRIRWILQEIDKFATGAKLVAAIDPAEESIRARHPEVVEGVTFYDDVDRMLDEAGLDGVLIGTNCLYHTPYAIKVLERNLPLFLEKPVGINEEQLAQLNDAMRASKS
ncbi:MAG TPA: Gfo/Idh/MocA family oxidoreductase, partial [Thermomicrobiales bacterium]|nr:Gfo/Idh/MocA family oxidoreductase [Thermomicrobiales bacterium]